VGEVEKEFDMVGDTETEFVTVALTEKLLEGVGLTDTSLLCVAEPTWIVSHWLTWRATETLYH
jgi:hypothetical protein